MRLLRFGFVSMTGLTVDVLLFLALVGAGLGAGASNAVSAATAVSLVYGLATRHVFASPDGFRLRPFAAYLCYQVVAVAAASAAVAWLDAVLGVPLLAKALVTPVTFLCNYGFMAALLSASRHPALVSTTRGALQ